MGNNSFLLLGWNSLCVFSGRQCVTRPSQALRPFAAHASPPATATPPTNAHVPLGLLVAYEGMCGSPAPEPTPCQCPLVLAPRQCPPVPAPRKCFPVPLQVLSSSPEPVLVPCSSPEPVLVPSSSPEPPLVPSSTLEPPLVPSSTLEPLLVPDQLSRAPPSVRAARARCSAAPTRVPPSVCASRAPPRVCASRAPARVRVSHFSFFALSNLLTQACLHFHRTGQLTSSEHTKCTFSIYYYICLPLCATYCNSLF